VTRRDKRNASVEAFVAGGLLRDRGVSAIAHVNAPDDERQRRRRSSKIIANLPHPDPTNHQSLEARADRFAARRGRTAAARFGSLLQRYPVAILRSCRSSFCALRFNDDDAKRHHVASYRKAFPLDTAREANAPFKLV
jgi:hypothetical protein